MDASNLRTMKVRCCVVGGGPAGMMLGYLLGRAGVDVVVLEKHADFFRDFRGDTVHPSTLQVMDELGLIDGFLKLPHQELQKMDGIFGGGEIAKTADDRPERLRGQFAQQVLGPDIERFRRHRRSGGGPLINGRTSIGMFKGAPLSPGAADIFAAI